MALFWEMGAVLGARGFGMRACPSRGRCLPRGDGVGNDRDWRVLGRFVTHRACNADAPAQASR